MKNQFYYIITLLKRLAIILAVFFILRILFYLFNYSRFGSVEFIEALKIIWGGLRFDASAILYFNLLFVLLMLIPFSFRNKRWYSIVSKVVFYVFNIIAICIALADIEYYQFNNKRITFEILAIVDEGQGMFFQFIKDFAYLYVMLAIIIVFIEFLYRKTTTKKPDFKPRHGIQVAIFIIVLPIFFVILRGGVGLKPLSPIMASDYVEVNKAPLVTCSPFTFINSFQQRTITEQKYFAENEEKQHFMLKKQYNRQVNGTKENVVLIILESFSSEYMGKINNYSGYTPFLDSIASQGLQFVNATANAERSNKGVAAILASFPSLMNDAFSSSTYQGNCINGIGAYLKQEGYHTSFFHGGTNGTMNFNSFTKSTGIENYYGRAEYNNEKDYDGKWGIYDEEFLQYFAESLSTFPQPFFSSVFTLSSHHPFSVPEKYKGKFPGGAIEVLESVGYTDYALRNFFEKASKEPWFKNTLFVITADHPYKVDEHFLPEYKTSSVKKYGIPFIFYKPGEIKPEVKNNIVSQIDIMPSVLDFIGFNKCFNAFGQSVFTDTANNFGYIFRSQIYQIFDNQYILYFDGSKVIGMFNYINDVDSHTNLAETDSIQTARLTNRIKAVVQEYNSSLVKNSLCNCEGN